MKGKLVGRQRFGLGRHGCGSRLGSPLGRSGGHQAVQAGFRSRAVIMGYRLALFLFLLETCAGVRGAEPVKIASQARVDVRLVEGGGSLDQGEIVSGEGTISRPNWLPATERIAAYTVECGINRFGWRTLAFRVTPAAAGKLELVLMGPFEEVAAGIVYRQEVEWDAIKVTGARLDDGGFEAGGASGAWHGPVRNIVAGTNALAPFEGKYFARTWHNEPLRTSLTVQPGRPVLIELHARAATPAGFKDMARITSRDTPAHHALAHFLKGANLGNGLEVPPRQTWAEHYTPADLRLIKAEGFDHVRIPVGWQHYTGPGPGYTIDPEFFARVDELVQAGIREGLGVIINIHHFDDLTSHPAANRARFLAIWDQVARHYAQAPSSLVFELLNEPKDEATTEVMNALYAEAIAVIRRSNPGRTIMVGPGKWNQIAELPNLRLPDQDHNLIVTIHHYEPFFFTHQSATWAGGDVQVLAGIVFPGPPEKPLVLNPKRNARSWVVEWVKEYNSRPAALNPSGPRAIEPPLEDARQWSEYYGRPLHLGEFGCFTAADAGSRARYYETVRKAAERSGIGWAIWDWKAGFRYWNPREGRPMPGMREALFGSAGNP